MTNSDFRNFRKRPIEPPIKLPSDRKMTDVDIQVKKMIPEYEPNPGKRMREEYKKYMVINYRFHVNYGTYTWSAVVLWLVFILFFVIFMGYSWTWGAILGSGLGIISFLGIMAIANKRNDIKLTSLNFEYSTNAKNKSVETIKKQEIIVKNMRKRRADYFDSMDFSSMNLNDINFSYCYFYDCNFDNSNLTMCNFYQCTFESCSFNSVNLTGANLTKVILKGPSFFNNSCLIGVKLDNALICNINRFEYRNFETWLDYLESSNNSGVDRIRDIYSNVFPSIEPIEFLLMKKK